MLALRHKGDYLVTSVSQREAQQAVRCAQAFVQAVTASEFRSGDRWTFDWPPEDARRIRFAVTVSAIDLLRSPENLARVRICPGDNCGWLFLDTSGRRRWCAMEVCGSRAKMRRLYARRRSG